MTTTTTPAGTTPTASAPAQRRPQAQPEPLLTVPPPPGVREKVVLLTTAALAERMHGEEELEKARKTVEDFGLTIEVLRLRERLTRAPRTDLQRLLLSIPGVPEALFNEAIAAQLAGEQQGTTAVKDTSVVGIGEQIGSASASLGQSLAAIQESTVKFQESAEQIVARLKDVADALAEQRPPVDVHPDAAQEAPDVAGEDAADAAPEQATPAKKGARES